MYNELIGTGDCPMNNGKPFIFIGTT